MRTPVDWGDAAWNAYNDWALHPSNNSLNHVSDGFKAGWEAALKAVEEVITTTRDAEANTYHANEIEAQARGFTMAARAVRGLWE
jgi:hypothetical protein